MLASRLIRGAGATGLFLSSAMFPARDASASDLYGFDIVGFRLGQSQEDVRGNAAAKLADADIEPVKRRLTYGSFQLDDVMFGVKIKEGKATPWYNAANKEFIQINYSLDAAPKVIYLHRQRIFDADTAPTLQSVMASLTGKYGPPAGVEGGGSQPVRLYWSSGPKTNERMGIASPLHICGYELISDGNAFSQMRDGNINFNPQYIDGIWPRCGATMTVKLDPIPSNRLLVYIITAAVGDFRQLQSSDHAIFDVLRKGEANKIQSGVQRGATNKAPL